MLVLVRVIWDEWAETHRVVEHLIRLDHPNLEVQSDSLATFGTITDSDCLPSAQDPVARWKRDAT